MKPAPVTPDDAERCAVLHSLDILDTPPEERFDRLTRLAQRMFGTRIALVSLVDHRRQWFKSRLGLDATETERSISFCGHAIASDSLFVIEDTLDDERFADNPLVVGAPHIRFYAGCPLRGKGGYMLGTLCVIDDKPRVFSDTDRENLRMLAGLVEEECAKPQPEVRSRPDDGGVVARFFAALRSGFSSRPAAAGMGVLAALVVLAVGGAWDRVQTAAYFDLTYGQVEQDLDLMSMDVLSELSSRLQPAVAVGAFVASSDYVSQEEFAGFAQRLLEEQPRVLGVQWQSDTQLVFQWPQEWDWRSHRRPETMGADEVVISRVQSPDAGGGLVLDAHFREAMPGNAHGPAGWATVIIDLAALFDQIGLTDPLGNTRYALRLLGAEQPAGGALMGAQSLFDARGPQRILHMAGQQWEIAAAPANGWPAGWPRQASFRLLILVFSVIVAALVFQALRMPVRNRRAIRRAVGELEANQARFRDAIHTLPAGFVIFDRDDRLAVCNERYRSLYKRSRPRLQVGRSFEEILAYGLEHGQYADAPEGDAKACADFAEILQQRHSLPDSAFDVELGGGRWVRVVESRMQDGGTVSFHVDVTEQKFTEHVLIDARQRADDANLAKSTFLATVSHEIRTPLNGVIGILSVLAGDTTMSEEQRTHVGTARSSARHLLTLLNEILDISKMEAGKLELEPVDFGFRSMVEGAAAMVRAQAVAKGLDFIVEIDDAAPRRTLRGDESRIRQVLLNLLSNAIKFTDQGEVRLVARAEPAGVRGCPVWLEVSDTGVGFDPADTERLFQPFKQIDGNAARRFAGTGLGLAISQRLMDMMGGSITATGRPGEGARFQVSFNLPEGAALSTEERDETAPRLLTPKELGWPEVRVLLAEDSPTNQLVFQAMLRGTGYTVNVVGNGREAVDAVAQFQYDAVLMDIFMPEMDGVEATRAIRCQHSAEELPIIALTANAMQGDEERFVDAGMNKYLTKPLERQALLAGMHDCLAPRFSKKPGTEIVESTG